MSKKKLSIIIPVYNVELYLNKCLCSCLDIGLDYNDYEIVVVNDGSTDQSLSIATTFEKECENVLVFSKANGGLSSARNYGLKKASGKYIWFIDSDDFINGRSVPILLDEMENNNLQVLAFNWLKVEDNKNLAPITNDENLKIDYNTKILRGSEFLDLLRSTYFAWRFLFERCFLSQNSFLFKDGILFEDLELIPRIILAADRVMGVPQTLYFYRQRMNSILNSLNEKLVLDSLDISRFYLELARCNPLYLSLAKNAYLIAFHYSTKPKLYHLKNETLVFARENRIKNIYKSALMNFMFNNNMSLYHLLLHLRQIYLSRRG